MKSSLKAVKSELVFKKSWPRHSEVGDEVLFIYDRILLKKSKSFKAWIKKAPLQYPVKAGESLKDIGHFAEHIEKITSLTQNTSVRKLTICVIGGGSVGDFGGFVASVLKRGVRLIHIPSTWLAALDSAHGGKTALNVAQAKNQIGTFYAAEKVFLIQELLTAQPEERFFEGYSELLKIALLHGQSFWQKLALEKRLDASLLWRYLPQAIAAKNSIVQKDPQEKTGHRHLLNLGHTVGHVVESLHQLPHGVAVNYGIDFALRWSQQRRLLSLQSEQEIRNAPLGFYLLSLSRDHLVPKTAGQKRQFLKLLLVDKKKTQSQKLRFIFLKNPGQAVIEEVSAQEILTELLRQAAQDAHEN